MFCSKCGNEIDDEAMICPKCGCATANMGNMKKSSSQSDESSGLATCAIVFAILMPIVGLILGIVGVCKYEDENLKKKSISAIILSIVIWVIYIFAIIILPDIY